MAKGKGMIRAANRSSAATGKVARAERAAGRMTEPTVCDRCGAVLSGRTWRQRLVTPALLARARWRQCPACAGMPSGEYWGRVVIRGAFAAADDEAIRRRIQNVAARARHTQPQRRLVSVQREGDGLEVLTTSQRLAHRIVHELKKTFRGRASYQWSDDGSLFAVWERD